MAHPKKYDNSSNKKMVEYNSYFLEEDYPGELEEIRRTAKFPEPLPLLNGPCVSEEYYLKFFTKEELARLCLYSQYEIRDLERTLDAYSTVLSTKSKI